MINDNKIIDRDPPTKKKYSIAIDVIENDQHYAFLESPKFDTEEEADNWYRSLNLINENKTNFDIVRICYNEDESINDSYTY